MRVLGVFPVDSRALGAGGRGALALFPGPLRGLPRAWVCICRFWEKNRC